MTAYPRVLNGGSHWQSFIAFVKLDEWSPTIRVRFRECTLGMRWKCDEHGNSRDIQCAHAQAVLHLTTQNGWAEHLRKGEIEMTEPKSTNPQLRAQLLLYRGLLGAGHYEDKATAITLTVNADGLLDTEGGVDREAIAKAVQMFPVDQDQLDRTGHTTPDRGLTALALIEATFEPDPSDRVAALLSSELSPAALEIISAQTTISRLILQRTAEGRERDVLGEVRVHLVDLMRSEGNL